MRILPEPGRAAIVTRRAPGALRRPTVAALTAALVVGAGACAASVHNDGGTRTIGRRQVVAKEAPETLVATRGERCTVDREKFEKVRTGDRVWCMWSGGRSMEDTIRSRGPRGR